MPHSKQAPKETNMCETTKSKKKKILLVLSIVITTWMWQAEICACPYRSLHMVNGLWRVASRSWGCIPANNQQESGPTTTRHWMPPTAGDLGNLARDSEPKMISCSQLTPRFQSGEILTRGARSSVPRILTNKKGKRINVFCFKALNLW